jgi:hypothetical protein
MLMTLLGAAAIVRAAGEPSIFDDTTPPAHRNSTTVEKPAHRVASNPPAENTPAAEAPTDSRVANPPAVAKLPAPDAKSLAGAERLIQELLGKDANGSPEIRKKAAAKLFAQARESANVAEQFAMLQRARQISASAGDAVTAFAAVREMADRFVVDERALRAETLRLLARSARDFFDVETTINEALVAMDQAVRADDYPGAMTIAGEVKPLADRQATSDAAQGLTSQIKRVRELALEYPPVKQGIAKLRESPSDAAANAVVGRFYCLRKHAWRSGLALLARGSEPKLRALAAAELAAGSTTAGALKVGDGWWDYALTQPEVIRSVVQAHAGDWYLAAQPGLTGIRKLQIRERLAVASRARAQISAQGGGRWVILLRSDDPSVWTHPAGNAGDRNGFGADIEDVAPADLAYLRIRRMDTGDFVIIPMKKEDLRKMTPTWCGSAWVGYGGTHLGVKHPTMQNVEAGLVDIDAHAHGWGFGHIMYAPEASAMGYARACATIEKTVFEIAVTSDDLNASEKRVLVVAP